jgi:outer membrane receptor protein involved in Fe transport
MGARLALCTGMMLVAVAGASAQEDTGSPKEQAPAPQRAQSPAPSQAPAPQQAQPPAPSQAPAPEQTQPPAPSQGQVPQLPPVTVITPKEQQAAKPKPQVKQGGPINAGRAPSQGARSPEAASQASAAPPEGTVGSQNANAVPPEFVTKVESLNAAREFILPKIGVNSYNLDRQAIEALPQGDNTPLDKVLLQTPGVSQDSAASGNLHIRNEHANLQYRINGIQLPDGLSGFGTILETSLIGNMAVVTGALPAQYGLRTSGLIDIQTRTGTSDPHGEISVYGGSHDTFTSTLQYGGVSGNTEYFFTGRFLENNVGIENPTPAYNAIHDETEQERFFSYVSTVLPDNARWTMMTGGYVGHFQIPNSPGQPPQYCTPATCAFDSSKLNETQLEQNYFGILAFQKSTGFADYQFSYFSRFASVHYMPDPVGDLVFNGIATDVLRTSFLNGIQTDGAFRIAPDHTLRAGMVITAEQTNVTDAATVFLSGTAGPNGNQLGDPSTPTGVAAPVQRLDQEAKLGWLAGVYLQDEWRITNTLTLNAGLRFDQMWQYVDANQLSPRIAAVYKPFDGTVLHAGYARYFTPPPQAVGAPENYALFNNTVAAASVTPQTVPGLVISPSLPERSHYFDAGVTQVLLPGLEAGLTGYYKIAQDLIDDGQFGQAYVLTAFNYAHAQNEGLELKLKYSKDGVLVYGNLAWAKQQATQFVSNQYLIDLPVYEYALTDYIYTDHCQLLTVSGGVSYPIWENTKGSVDVLYGSGLRSGFANTTTVSPYTQVNLGLSHEFNLPDWKPFTLRFDVVNLLDDVYLIRSGTGIGVFAPQYGPRRGFFVGFSQKF